MEVEIGGVHDWSNSLARFADCDRYCVHHHPHHLVASAVQATSPAGNAVTHCRGSHTRCSRDKFKE